MHRHKGSYLRYYNILGFIPNNIQIYEQALLHRSSSIRTEEGQWINNERLEFLGDAILDAIVADIVFRKFDGKKEGFLTNTRSKIVQRETLNRLALELGLDKLIITSTRSVSHNNYIYGNAFEAFVGAIYLDQGYPVCKRFIEEKIIAPYIDLKQIARKEVNFKSRLIEWSQKMKMKVDFALIEAFMDDDNNPVFQTQILIYGLSAGVGIGYSKKESQQNAAKAAMKRIDTEGEFLNSLIAERDRLIEAASRAETEKELPADSSDDVHSALDDESIDAQSSEQEGSEKVDELENEREDLSETEENKNQNL